MKRASAENRRGKGRGHGPPPRRPPPSSRTGLEMQFFEGMIQSETRLVLVLADGTEVRGVVREVDRDQLTVDGPSGQVVIRKSEIRYVSEDSE